MVGKAVNYILHQSFYMQLIEWLKQLDRDLFIYTHTGFNSYYLDEVMLLMRNPLTWIPLYAGLLWYIAFKQKKVALQFIFITLVTFAFTDFISASVIKPWAGRLRPCYTPELAGIIRPIIDCGGKYSFPSTHASNHFGLAMFWFCSIYQLTGRRWYWLFLWAALICFAQVYVGKHYPLDVMGGALFGTVTGYLMWLLFRRWTSNNIQPSKTLVA